MLRESTLPRHAWCWNTLFAEPSELARDEREKGKTEKEVKAARRGRFNFEKQRRAGPSQIWELLSYAGCVTEELLAGAFKRVEESGSASERAGKDESAQLKRRAPKVTEELRYGRMLQRREAKYANSIKELSKDHLRILQETKDSTLKRKVNSAMLRSGRGRLRGATEHDYVDIGTNRKRSEVQRMLDGERPAPDTSRFDRETSH